MLVCRPGVGGDFNADAVEQNRRRPDQCVVRAGETENAMGAAGVALSGVFGRKVGRGLRGGSSVVQAQLERRPILIGVRKGGETADRDQQPLRGDGIGDEETDERPPHPLAPGAEIDHVVA